MNGFNCRIFIERQISLSGLYLNSDCYYTITLCFGSKHRSISTDVLLHWEGAEVWTNVHDVCISWWFIIIQFITKRMIDAVVIRCRSFELELLCTEWRVLCCFDDCSYRSMWVNRSRKSFSSVFFLNQESVYQIVCVKHLSQAWSTATSSGCYFNVNSNCSFLLLKNSAHFSKACFSF